MVVPTNSLGQTSSRVHNFLIPYYYFQIPWAKHTLKLFDLNISNVNKRNHRLNMHNGKIKYGGKEERIK